MTARAICLEGDLAAPGLADWVAHRARLLDLRGWFEQADAGRVDIFVVGLEPMVEAMEISCSLGPADVLVQRLTAREATLTEDPPTEFLIR